MKTTRRPPPLDFGASNDDARASGEEAAPKDKTAAVLQASTPAPAEPPVERAPPKRARAAGRGAPSGFVVYLVAFAVAVLWALGPIAFAVGYRSGVAPLQHDRFALIVFSLLALGPAVLVFGVAWFIRQGQLLAAETQRTRELEQTLLTPALRAAVEAGEVTRAVREEIAAAASAADVARESLSALRQVLSGQTESLVQATQSSLNAAQQLSGELGRERGELQALTQALDSQAVRAAEVVSQQAQKAAAVSQAAEAQLQQAESLFAARTAGLAAAADEASAVVRTASEDLARHSARLETAGAGVGEQVRAVEGGLAEQRAALAALGQSLRDDQQAFAGEVAAQTARLDEVLIEVRRTAGDMTNDAFEAGETLRRLIAEARERFAAIVSSAQAEREALGEAAAGSLDVVGRAVAEQRARLEADNRQALDTLARAAEETRQAAARHAAAAREQVDQLSEAAFAAGQRANQVFEARLEEARALVEQSAKMVGDTGAAAVGKLQEGAVAARATIDELAALIETLEARARTLPAEARTQVEAVQARLGEGVEALMAQARRTADEAQAIDAAFQDRVRRNFDMLSEAVRLMGAVAGAPPAGPAQPPPASPPPFTPAYAPPVVRAASPPTASVEPAAPPAADPPTEPQPGAALAERLGLRPRLKLTPTQSDAEFSAIFDSPAAAAPPAQPDAAAAEDADEDEPAETWTWKDLLASLGGGEPGEEPEEAALAAELGKMGVEPGKLLPEARIEQIAAAIQSGDHDGARQVVKKLAGASSRRIVRRLFTDEALKARAGAFVRRYQALVDDAAVRDAEGYLLAEILGSEAGRVYLLLDQALGDAA